MFNLKVFWKMVVWAALFIPELIFTLLAYPLAPFIVLATSKEGDSPQWCWPWLTYDNPIDGDGGHIRRWAGIFLAYPKLFKYEWVQRYCQRVAWLWRNKAYNVAYYWFGAYVTPTKYIGRIDVESGHPGRPGYVFAISEEGYWTLFVWKPFTSKFALRIYFGWKFKGRLANMQADHCMQATHINPFRRWDNEE